MTTAAAPLVSVVTIFLDAERYLAEAVTSVRHQTYERWELLLVDDGSTDGSVGIARDFAAREPGRIRYLDHPGHANRGKSTSRNLGIMHARGDYLTFLDADDVFLPDKLARQVAILAAEPTAAMVYGRTLYWFSWTGTASEGERDCPSRLGVSPDRIFPPPVLLTTFLRDSGTVPCICSLLARTAMVRAVGGFDETIQHLYEDQVFLAKMCLAAPVYVENGCGERYRQHAESSSARAMRTGEYDPWAPNPARRAFLTWLTDYAAARMVGDEVLRAAVDRAWWPFRHPHLHRGWRGVLELSRVVRRYGHAVERRLLRSRRRVA